MSAAISRSISVALSVFVSFVNVLLISVRI